MDFMVNMAVDFFLLRSSVGITKEVASDLFFDALSLVELFVLSLGFSR